MVRITVKIEHSDDDGKVSCWWADARTFTRDFPCAGGRGEEHKTAATLEEATRDWLADGCPERGWVSR